MFESDFILTGKHASYTKHLNEAGVFTRYIDVYMTGAIFGFLYGRTAKRDIVSSDRGRIYADAMIKERSKCYFIYRLIMLLDEGSNLTVEQRIDRAFRLELQDEGAKKENMDLFHKYVYGGIEVLYEQFAEHCSNRDDYVERIHEVVSTFKDEIEGISHLNKISKVIDGGASGVV